MSLSAKVKEQVIKEYGRFEGDTGSPEVQIALLTNDINLLTEHFKTHQKDHHSRRGLIRKVNLRRKLLAYLRDTNSDSYKKLIEKLKLRG